MADVVQRKKVGREIISWTVDKSKIRKVIPWAKRNPSLLDEELDEMSKTFQHFYVVLTTKDQISRGDIFCPRCKDIIIFDRGIRCVSCGTTFKTPSSPQLGFVGQIPHWLGVIDAGGSLGQRGVGVHGHPFLKHVHGKLRSMSNAEKQNISRYFLTLPEEGRVKVFFAPPIYAVYPDNWPKSRPNIYVERTYFDEVLFKGTRYSHSSFHAYSEGSNKLLRLCNYVNWHRVTMRIAMEQRIVPKIMMDVMIADLVVKGKLEKVVSSLGTNVHSVYNWIGKSGRKERFSEEFNKYIQIDS